MPQIEADWLASEPTQCVFAALAGFPTFAVGGCVRNTLLREPVNDIDFATAARPEEVIALGENAGFRMVPTGIEHGTVTAVVSGVPYEITTFRRDVATDGRRAVVAFADDLSEDASRRDFTINALYADANGEIHDPVDGLADIAKRRVRFIENAERRIREDYLRSLRFFRFHAWYGDAGEGPDPEALDAISKNLIGLGALSRERVGAEILRLLAAPNPAPAVASMRATGALRVVLAGGDDKGLAPLVALEQSLQVEPSGLRRLAVLGGDTGSLRLSRKEATYVDVVRSSVGLNPKLAGYKHGVDLGQDICLVSAALFGQPLGENAFAEVKSGADELFPVEAADLMPNLTGKALGDALQKLEDAWIDSGFTLSKEELLAKG